MIEAKILSLPSRNTTILTIWAGRLSMAPRERHDYDNIGKCVCRHQKWHDFCKILFLLVIWCQILSSSSRNTTILTIWAKRLLIAPRGHHDFDNIGKCTSRHKNDMSFIKSGSRWWLGVKYSLCDPGTPRFWWFGQKGYLWHPTNTMISTILANVSLLTKNGMIFVKSGSCW